MTREEKNTIIENLIEAIKSNNHFYLTDISALNAEDTSNLRRVCHKHGIKMVVVKNKLLAKALERLETDSILPDQDCEQLVGALRGNTSVMFTEQGNIPAKMIKEYRKKNRLERPLIKAAYVEESVYLGDDQLEALVAIKSKNELIAELIGLLQSPVKTVMSQLQSGSNILHGVLKTLGEKDEQ